MEEIHDSTQRDVGKPVTPTSIYKVMQKYSLLLVDKIHAVIVDTGASMSISFDASDFVGLIKPLSLQTLARWSEQMQVEGEGYV
eukprot:2407077-Ditylum_brightwellii.AAC.1